MTFQIHPRKLANFYDEPRRAAERHSSHALFETNNELHWSYPAAYLSIFWIIRRRSWLALLHIAIGHRQHSPPPPAAAKGFIFVDAG